MGVKATIKEFLFQTSMGIIYYTNLYKLILKKHFQNSKAVCLFYHDVSPDPSFENTSLIIKEDLFWKHISKLEKDFSFIALSEIFDDKKQLPNNPVILTFDGYSKRYLALAEKLSHKGIKALFYIHTQPIEDQEVFWRQKLYYIISLTQNIGQIIEKLSKILGYSSQEFRNRQDVFLTLENFDDKRRVLTELAKTLKIDLAHFSNNNMPLRPEEVEKISKLEGITVGSHSHTHPVKDRLPSSSFEFEIVKSKSLLESWTNESVDHFAYPSGKLMEDHFEILQRNGYLSAASTRKKLIYTGNFSPEQYSLPRYGVQNSGYSHLIGEILGLKKKINSLI